MTSNLTFWKPGTTGPGSTLDRATEAEGNVVQSAPSYNSSIQAQRERLPIFKHSSMDDRKEIRCSYIWYL
jgi:ATP-dependent RNA helicase DDX35